MQLREIIGEPKSYDEAMEVLKSNEWAYKEFLTFKREHQEDILAFIQGNKGLPILYDGFFKFVFDPERHPERLEDFLSEVLGQKVKIEEVLAREGNKLVEDVSPEFMHRLQNTFDSGVKVNLLSNLVYISLDTFREVRENISDRMVAWLTFLSSDKPEDIIRLVEEYPEFKECYHDIMRFRTNPEELIHMFSEALIQMDKNTVRYMIEEQQKELEEQRKELAENKKELEENKKELDESKKELEKKEKEIEELKRQLDVLRA